MTKSRLTVNCPMPGLKQEDYPLRPHVEPAQEYGWSFSCEQLAQRCVVLLEARPGPDIAAAVCLRADIVQFVCVRGIKVLSLERLSRHSLLALCHTWRRHRAT